MTGDAFQLQVTQKSSLPDIKVLFEFFITRDCTCSDLTHCCTNYSINTKKIFSLKQLAESGNHFTCSGNVGLKICRVGTEQLFRQFNMCLFILNVIFDRVRAPPSTNSTPNLYTKLNAHNFRHWTSWSSIK